MLFRSLDFLSGIGSVCLGHCNAAVSEAIAVQAKKLMHVGNYFYVEGRGELAQSLSLLLNNKDKDAEPWKLFFGNSGAEANEGALKLARKYGKQRVNGAGTIITAKRSFHGRTLATTAATGQAAKQESFAPMPSGFALTEPGDIQDLVEVIESCKQAAASKGCPELAPVAVMLECIQGEGGVWPLSPEYLKEVRALTQENGMLLMIDEVQTGFYRTGVPFSYIHAGIRPDVVTLAKGIANGFPCGALAATGKAASVFVPGEHGSTFGGSSLAIAAARATVEELEKQAIGSKVKEQGAYFKTQLGTLPHVIEVRGEGLMLGISLDVPAAAQVVDEILEQGVIINGIGDTILRFLPPLVVGKEEIDKVIELLKELLASK